ncbi:uncharacterized protein [Triticum aestivum]|uniref:uncharacterized protein n=1 Tax=Triticum aestivum TaxID=4565 RepID=UPI001D01F65E|nr:uncharacterized protein LOC123187359 [Triticum aestivum]
MLNYFRIGQRCNVYIHGRRFFNTELIKFPWTQEEDDKIIDLVNKYGLAKWSHCKPLPWHSYSAFSACLLWWTSSIANEQTVALFFNQVVAAIWGNTFGLGASESKHME